MEALGYVPVTVLPAIIAPMVLLGPGGSFEADPQRVVAALVALGVGAVARSLLGAIVAGMAAFILWGALGL
jgi:branched-subunit amino acid transport protein